MPMKRCLLIFHFILIFTTVIFCQRSQPDTLLRDIGFYADVMVNADHVDHRMRAHEEFVTGLRTFLEGTGSMDISLDSIPWISTLAGDGFRLITWQLKISDDEYKYGGFIQRPDRLIELKDTRPWVNGSLRNTYSPPSWYGALYYKIIPFKAGKGDHYVVFGFNAENSYVNTKVADVLDLSGDEPVFGMPVFTGRGDPQTRLILTYADASSVQLIYDAELNAIVHDHLESLAGVGPEGGSLAVSDGSQEGWIFKGGKWNYKEEMYDVQSELPPMTEERKERKEDKDLFGKPRQP